MNVFEPRWRSRRPLGTGNEDGRVSGKHLTNEPGKPGEGFSGLSGSSGEAFPGHTAPTHPCVSCGAGAGEGVLYCPACWEARKARGNVLPFDATRRVRAVARLSGRSCGSCGQENWHVTDRGDASCVVCFKDWKPTVSVNEVIR